MIKNDQNVPKTAEHAYPPHNRGLSIFHHGRQHGSTIDQPFKIIQNLHIYKKKTTNENPKIEKKNIQKKHMFPETDPELQIVPHALTRRATVSWFRSVTVVWRVWRGMAMGKRMGKWWKIHGKIRCKWSKSKYPPVMTNITIENGHLS